MSAGPPGKDTSSGLWPNALMKADSSPVMTCALRGGIMPSRNSSFSCTTRAARQSGRCDHRLSLLSLSLSLFHALTSGPELLLVNRRSSHPSRLTGKHSRLKISTKRGGTGSPGRAFGSVDMHEQPSSFRPGHHRTNRQHRPATSLMMSLAGTWSGSTLHLRASK